ncbi:hypothetical protein GOODEAATRI_024576 [Goodea atripinnis]|uniref:UBZ1-type domain-containing protein n=1 Tax=Goodea atripinnis TaxID=208336 RepID=A0ABV0NDB9_9TELE
MSELYHMKLEADALRQAKAEAQAQCVRMELTLEQMKADAKKEAAKSEEDASPDPAVVAELQREVDDLKLRLLMAAEHYKEKYKECQRLQKQVLKLSEQQGVGTRRHQPAFSICQSSPGSADPMLEAIIQEKLKGISREALDRNDKYRKCKQLLMEEKERSSMFSDELTKTELKLKEQLKTNENLKLQLAAAEDRYKSQIAGKGRELKELRDTFALVMKEKEKLEGVHDQPLKLPPVGPPSWDSNVVCIQPSRNLSRPEGHEEAEENNNVSSSSRLAMQYGSVNTDEQPLGTETRSPFVNDGQTPFCFDSSALFLSASSPCAYSMDMKRCPLCEVIFPPNYDQGKFEEHVESHWKTCPMCSEQFPLDCEQKVYENHVLTHFDGRPLNFD